MNKKNKQEFEIVKINNKWSIKLPETRAKWWKTQKDWEKKRLNSMAKHIDREDVVYYVGAEVGDMPALCQMWGAKVCLFEPNWSGWPWIREIWKLNNLKKPLGCFAMFVGSKTNLEPKRPDQALFEGGGWKLKDDGWPKYVDGDYMENHGFSELHKEQDGLPVVTLDDVAVYQKTPTAISIDVEGAEFEVLKGAENVINFFKPKIWLSLHPKFVSDYWKVEADEIRQWLKDRGYKETLLDNKHEMHLFYEVKDESVRTKT